MNLSYYIDYTLHRPLDKFEPDDFVKKAVGKVYCINDDEDQEAIGIVEGSVFCPSPEVALFDMYDAAGGHTFEYYEDYVSPYLVEDLYYGEIRLEDVDHYVELPYNTTVCSVNFLGIRPEFRGNEIGLEVIKNFIQTFGDGQCGSVLIKPCPQTFNVDKFKEEDYHSLDSLFKSEKDGEPERLISYYSQLGFRKIVDTELMFLSLEYRREW